MIWFVTLPNSGIVVRMPWLFQRSSVAEPIFCRGYLPDIEAIYTYDSWRAGRDPAMEAALAYARQQGVFAVIPRLVRGTHCVTRLLVSNQPEWVARINRAMTVAT